MDEILSVLTVIFKVVYTYQLDRLFCYSCHCHWPFRYISFHRTEAPGCCTRACDSWLLRHTLLNMSPKETMVPNHHQLKRHTAKVGYWTSWFQAHSSVAGVACQNIPEADGESGTLKVREETYCVDFNWHFLTKQQEVRPKYRKCCPGGFRNFLKAWGSFHVYHERSCNGNASVEFRCVLLTWTGVSVAGLGLSPIAIAVLASQLRHRSVTVTYSGDLPFPASHRAWWPWWPQTPASVLPNWD